MSIRKAGQVIAGTPNITTGHHVGEIFYTSRLGIEINGAVEANGSIYNVDGYKGNESVPELLRKGELPHVSMEEYNRIIEEYGSCRAWGWDNGDTFRVPTLKDVYLMAGQAESAGEFISESLPNIAGKITSSNGYAQFNWVAGASGAFSVETHETTYSIGQNSNPQSRKDVLNFNASRSSSTYQDGAKVRPDSVRYRAMVQLTTGVTEDATQLKEYKFNNPFFFGMSIWSEVTPSNGSWLISNGNFHSGKRYVDYYQWLTSSLGKDHIKGMIGYAFKKPNEEVRWWTAKRNPEIGDAIFGGYDILKIGVINKVNLDGTIGFYEDAYSVQLDNLIYTESENINVDGTGFANLVWANDYDWIINQNDQTFRLPLKTKLASGSAVVGNGMAVGLMDGTKYYGMANSSEHTDDGTLGIYEGTYGQAIGTTGGSSWRQGATYATGVTTDPDKSGIETSSNGLNLYFYVGDTLQDTNLIQTGEILDYFSKIHTVHCVVDTYKNGSSWYRVYDDGWVEQGGTLSLTACPQTITLLKQYQDNNYTICIGGGDPDSNASVCATSVYSRAVGSFSLVSGFNGTFYSCVISWIACGYGA